MVRLPVGATEPSATMLLLGLVSVTLLAVGTVRRTAFTAPPVCVMSPAALSATLVALTVPEESARLPLLVVSVMVLAGTGWVPAWTFPATVREEALVRLK